MGSNFYGVSAYQQTSQSYSKSDVKKSNGSNQKVGSSTTSGSAKTSASGAAESASSVTSSDIKTKTWTPLDNDSCLIPTVKEGYGMSIGNVELSDKAKDYYSTLKKKFGNAEFILVSKDMKASVQANAAAYGNANKMVVLIDEEKLERMATDESYRKKYEGIIAMSQAKLAEAKNSLTSSGANVKNFGMSVNSDGTTSFFATLEKSSKDQAKRIEKKAAEKREQKIKDKKAAEKKAAEARLEKAKEKSRTEREERSERMKNDSKKAVNPDLNTDDVEDDVDKEYIEIQADSMEELLAKVQDHAYTSSGVQAEAEKYTGQNFDFRG